MPTVYPKTTKATVTVENHDGFGRRGFDVEVIAHVLNLVVFRIFASLSENRVRADIAVEG